jgi:mRNA interferase HigB
LSRFVKPFPTADLGRGTGKVIFNICGNRYRLVAVVNFEQQAMSIQSVLTHKEYDRENL